MFLLLSEGGDCSLVAGLSVTLTFLMTVILSFLVALLVAMFVRVHRRKTKNIPPDPVFLCNVPFSGGHQKEALNMPADVTYEHVQPQSTQEIDNTYEDLAL